MATRPNPAPRPPAQSPEAKHWCFTYNNPTMYPEEMIEELEDLGVTYAVFQLEEGKWHAPLPGLRGIRKKSDSPPSNTYFVAPGTGKFPGARQPKIGNIVQKTMVASEISPKLALYPRAKARSDLVGLHSALKDGLTQADYANEYFSKFIQYPNLVQNYVVSTIEARDPSKPFSSWLLIGPAGTGKSRLARELGRRIGNGLSSDTLSESGSTDTEENELSYSTIFADLHSLSRNLNAFLTDTPFEWNSRGLLVKWQPQTSSSPQTKTPKRGGKKA